MSNDVRRLEEEVSALTRQNPSLSFGRHAEAETQAHFDALLDRLRVEYESRGVSADDRRVVV